MAIEVIITDLRRKGNGKELMSPVRSVTEIYNKEGELISFNDSCGNFSIEQMGDFAGYCRENSDLKIEDAFKAWKR